MSRLEGVARIHLTVFALSMAVTGRAAAGPVSNGNGTDMRPPLPMAAVALPALRSDPTGTVRLQSCAISVRVEHIAVVCTVDANQDAPALLLEGEKFGWTGEPPPYSQRHFPELEIKVDGILVRPEEYVEAFAGNRNIANLLQIANLDPWAITRTPPIASANEQRMAALRALTNLDAIERTGDGYLAKWEARRVVRIALGATGTHRVAFDYTLRPALSMSQADDIDTSSRDETECVSPAVVRHAIHTRATSAPLALSEITLLLSVDDSAALSAELSVEPKAAPQKMSPAITFFCGTRGKPRVKHGSFEHERIDIDARGRVQWLSVIETTAAS